MSENIKLLRTIIIPVFKDYFKVLGSPKQYVLELYTKSRHEKEEINITKAIVFFLCCTLAVMIFTIPIYGSENLLAEKRIMLSQVVDFIFLCSSSLVLFLSWKMVGSKIPFWRYFYLFSYHIGVALSFYLFVNMICLSILRSHDINLFQQVIDSQYLKLPEVADPLDLMFERLDVGLYAFATILNLFFIVGWLGYSWTVYRDINSLSKAKNIIAAIVFIILLIASFALNGVIGRAIMES